jgi:peroxiredoxin
MENVELERAARPRRWASLDVSFVVLLIAITIAVAFVIKLARQNAQLKAGMVRPEGTLAGPHAAQSGDLVPGFKTTDIAGRPIEIVFDGSRKSLIYIFSPGCDVCTSELANWNRIAGEAVSQNYKVLGISIDSFEESRKRLADSKLQFDVAIMPSMSLQRAYRAISIPEVLIVSGDGRIDWAYYGAMNRQTTEEMLAIIRSGS